MPSGKKRKCRWCRALGVLPAAFTYSKCSFVGRHMFASEHGDIREVRPTVQTTRYIGEMRHREASNPVAVLRSRSATKRPSWPYG